MKQGDVANVTDDHQPALGLLDEWLRDHANGVLVGANPILDAVTVHDSETARVTRTLAQ